MKVKYIIHKYAGRNEDKTVTVSGETAKTVLEYQYKQDEVGITILEIDGKLQTG